MLLIRTITLPNYSNPDMTADAVTASCPSPFATKLKKAIQNTLTADVKATLWGGGTTAKLKAFTIGQTFQL